MARPIVTITDNGDGETVVTVNFGHNHVVTFEVWNDVGTYRLLEKYNGSRVRDITDGGGHLEDRQVPPQYMPTAYQVSVV